MVVILTSIRSSIVELKILERRPLAGDAGKFFEPHKNYCITLSIALTVAYFYLLQYTALHCYVDFTISFIVHFLILPANKDPTSAHSFQVFSVISF